MLALREMRRVCRPGGVVAARDSDYAAITWYPAVPELDEWLALYQRVARHNGGEPDAGRRLLAWARAAGFADVDRDRGHMVLRRRRGPAWWSGIWAERIVASAIAAQAEAYGFADRPSWNGSRPAGGVGRVADGWFTVLHGEILCRR